MAEVSHTQWEGRPSVEMAPGINRQLVTGDKVMIVKFTLDEGAKVPEHHHPHEQISNVISGVLEFTVDGEKYTVRAGESLVIPSNVPHSATVLEAGIIHEVFAPPREDFL